MERARPCHVEKVGLNRLHSKPGVLSVVNVNARHRPCAGKQSKTHCGDGQQGARSQNGGQRDVAAT